MRNNSSNDKADLIKRARILAACYHLILSWPDPLEEKAEPVADVLGGVAATGPLNTYPNSHSDQSTCEDAQASGEQGGTTL